MRHKPRYDESPHARPGDAAPRVKTAVILISGRGSNLRAILEAHLPCRFAAVISSRADAAGLAIARAHGVPAHALPHDAYPDRAGYEAALEAEIAKHQPDLVVLAGFMRILSAEFVQRYHGRMINIHPSLLPAYAGLATHQRALEDGVKIHGCTVHFVTADLDHGPIIIQAAVAVLHDDTPESLSARVLHEEHRIFPQAIRWFCTGRVALGADGRVSHYLTEQPAPALVAPGLD